MKIVHNNNGCWTVWDNLPVEWPGCDDLRKLDWTALNGLGFFQVEETQPTADPRLYRVHGPRFEQVDNGVTMQWHLEPRCVEEVREMQLARIKADAGEAILAQWPLWKQNNLLAESAALLRMRQEAAWTEGQAARVAELEAIWEEIQGIRAVSDAREVALWNAATAAEICRIVDTPHPEGVGRAWDSESGEWVVL